MARDWTARIPAAVLAASGLTRGDVAGAGVARSSVALVTLQGYQR